MLWTVVVDSTLIDAFSDVGQPDQAVVDAYLRSSHKRQHPQKHAGMRRWYYLMCSNPRVRLCSVGMSLADFAGKPAKILVGTNEILGEFKGNRALVGKRGLQLQCQPIAWLHGQADKHFANGAALLAEISEQVLDLRAIEQSQEQIKRRYEWHRR